MKSYPSLSSPFLESEQWEERYLADDDDELDEDESAELEGHDEYELLNLMFEVEDTCSCQESGERETGLDFEGQVRKRRARRRRVKSRRRRISLATEDKERESAVDSPYRWICLLTAKFPNGDVSTGTGVLIGPAHVLTAAHTVRQYSENVGAVESASRVEVMPAYDRRRPGGEKAIFGAFEIRTVPEQGRKATSNQSFVPKEYRIVLNDSGEIERADNLDIAVLKLEKPIGTRNFPSHVGRIFRPLEFWGSSSRYEIRSIDPPKLGSSALHMAGYPGDDNVMIVSEGLLDTKKQEELSEKATNFFHTMRTRNGDSGSPIWREVSTGRRTSSVELVGIHAGKDKSRIGVAVTDGILKMIAAWDSETFRLANGRLSVRTTPGTNPTIRDICGNP